MATHLGIINRASLENCDIRDLNRKEKLNFVMDGKSIPFRHANTLYLRLNRIPSTSIIQSRIEDILPAEYIWQRDPLKISVDNDGNAETSISFGDNIQDEWMIVYIVQKLSLDFPDIVAKLTDDDGQFLLIEAANSLPHWVKPETCEDRAFIYRNEVHIIPMQFEFGSFEEACEIIRHSPNETLSPEATFAINQRLQGFVDRAVTSCQHYGRCILHKDAISLLGSFPWLITAISESFYFRDPIDLRYCTRMERFTPDPNNFLWHSVRFTHCSFAQLETQQFKIPSIFDSCYPSSESHQSGFIRGAKLLCGLEILYQNQKKLLQKGKHLDYIVKDVSTGLTVVELIDNIDHDARSAENIPFESVRDDDPSKWMNICEEDLQAMIQPYAGSTKISGEDIANRMKAFFTNLSDLDGIANADAPIQFDTDEFLNAFQSDENEGEDFYEEVTSDENMNEYDEQLQQEMDLKPVNPDINLVKNILEAFKAEMGQAGPASILLNNLGIHLPDDESH